MAPLPKSLEIMAPRLRDMMASGTERDKAKKLVLRLLREGRATPQVQQIAAELFDAKRGRPRAGVKHRWMEVGQMNDDLAANPSLSEDDRLGLISEKFKLKGVDYSGLRKLITQYNNCLAQISDERD